MKNYDLKAPVCAAEFALDALIGIGEVVPVYQPTPIYPAVPRDLAVVVDKAMEVGTLEAAIRSAEPAYLKAISVFDIYEGLQVGAGKKSVAFSLTFQADDQTLTDDLVQAEMDKIVAALERDCQGQLRA